MALTMGRNRSGWKVFDFWLPVKLIVLEAPEFEESEESNNQASSRNRNSRVGPLRRANTSFRSSQVEAIDRNFPVPNAPNYIAVFLLGKLSSGELQFYRVLQVLARTS